MQTQYYQISETGYPIISPIQLDGFTTYEVGSEPKELVASLKAMEAQEAQSKVNQEALAYLASTDWYVARFSETGTVIPDDVKQKRQEARASII